MKKKGKSFIAKTLNNFNSFLCSYTLRFSKDCNLNANNLEYIKIWLGNKLSLLGSASFKKCMQGKKEIVFILYIIGPYF